MDVNAIRLALQQLAATLQTRNPTEDDLEKGFVDVYRALGYAIAGRDYRNKARDSSGIPDVMLHNSDRSIQVIVELKKPSENLEGHVGQLAQYLRSLREARWGLLSNGHVWRAYQRDGQSVDLVWEIKLEELQRDPSVLESFERQLIEVTNYRQVEDRLKAANREGLTPQGLNDLATDEFLFTFSLKEGSPFASLVGATQELLIALEDSSDFVRGAYDFWKKVYAREIDSEDIPKLWLASKLGIQNNKEGLFRFSYALETAYTLTARLILAKAIQDKDVTHSVTKTNLAERLLEHLKAKRNLRSEEIEPESYLEATNDLFDDYARTLFTSIYAKDIFDWWRDYPSANQSPRRAFAKAVADLEIALLRFDFRTLEGDLLGEMYQRYFDADTRKALGEFYTPKAVVDFILDEVGYDGNGTLLDPATGSGTFIVSALRRYLKANASKDPEKTLRGITEEFKLVAFDVNPFAVIMAQIGFASELLPLYGKAIAKNKNFVLRRLPIVRTDSLRKETIEGEQLEQKDQIGFAFEEREIKAKLELPVKIGTEFLTVEVVFPRLETAKNDGVIGNVREWLQALQSVFAAVEVLSQAKDKAQTLPKLEAELKRQLSAQHANPEKLLAYLEPYAQGVWKTLLNLKVNHGDGRFLKTLEDLMLGLVLKHYMRYGFVVGNPPYVRVQNIPEFQRRYWESKYAWVERNFDIFVPFIERALHGESQQTAEESCWLEEGGRLGFIVPNRFTNVEYASTFRAQFSSTATVVSITDFKAVKFKPAHASRAESIFAEASVYPAILIAENTTPKADYSFRAARMFPTEAMLEPADALKAIKAASVTGANSAVLKAGAREYADVFLQGSQHLRGNGWFLMPADERAVFEKLEAIAKSTDKTLPKDTDQTRKLENYTATSSGGFQGIKTGKDEIFILEQVGEDENFLVLNNAEENQIRLERGVLQKFLFGGDLTSWTATWESKWIVFPYFEYQGRYLLLPTREFWNFDVKSRGGKKRRVFEGYPENPPFFEDSYPNCYKYLLKNRKILEKRENGKYSSQTEKWRWYELSRPQNLEWNFVEKILLKELASKAEVVLDKDHYILAGARIYGIVPKGTSAHFLASVVGSQISDYLIKNIATTFGSGFYSYADQFIKNLPIPVASKKQHTEIVNVVDSLTAHAAAARGLEQDIRHFPESITAQKRSSGNVPDLETLEHLLIASGGLPNEIRWDARASIEHNLMGETVLSIPRGKNASTTFTASHATLLEVIAATLRERGKIGRSELLGLRIPEREKDQREYLETLREQKQKLEHTRAEIQKLEANLNDIVYAVFNLTAQDRKVIECFLERF